ncbi:MAG: trypsin-like serine protease [Nanoarchaeota archaeon]
MKKIIFIILLLSDFSFAGDIKDFIVNVQVENVVNNKTVLYNGTGVIASYKDKVFILSAKHLMENTAKDIFIWQGSIRIIPKYTIKSKTHDFIIIFSDQLKYGLPLEDNIRPNLQCLAVGFGYKSGYVVMPCKTIGIFLSVTDNYSSYIKTDCKLEHGMSGGALLCNNKVIGINSFVTVQKPIVGIHMPANYIIEILNKIKN